jgi:hypothetical protein
LYHCFSNLSIDTDIKHMSAIPPTQRNKRRSLILMK